MVVNYPSADVPFTRIVEYKHTPNQPEAARTGEVKGTLIAKAGWCALNPSRLTPWLERCLVSNS